jgi:hypothetical protein
MRDNRVPADGHPGGATVHGDLHVTGRLTADGELQITQRAVTGNSTDTASIGIGFVIHALYRRIDDLDARLASLAAAQLNSAALRTPAPKRS